MSRKAKEDSTSKSCRKAVFIALCGIAIIGSSSWAVLGQQTPSGRTQKTLNSRVSEVEPSTISNYTPIVPSRRIAILSTPDNGPETLLHIVETGRPFPEPVAKFRHLADAAVQGALLPDGRVVVVADHDTQGDGSFGSGLFLLEAGHEALLLCDGIAYGSRPLVTREGRVLVERGTPGTQTNTMRLDYLSIDEVDTDTGQLTTVWKGTGYIAFNAAVLDNMLVIYHTGQFGARLISVDLDSHDERLILSSLPPFASDFSITEKGDLIFQNRAAYNSNLWLVERLNIHSGDLRILRESNAPDAPRAWPGGAVTWNDSGSLRQAAATSSTPGKAQSLIDIRAIAADGKVAVGFVLAPDASPRVVLVDSSGTELAQIAVPSHTRLNLAGFMP